MEDHERESLYQKTIDTWGREAQVMMFFEETAELQKEVCKYFFRKESTATTKIEEEIADVEIMIEQLKMMLNVKKNTIDEIKHHKLKRLQARLEQWTEQQKT